MADIVQPKSIPERNALMQMLLNENGTNAPTPTPNPSPPPKTGLGHMLAKLLGMGG